MDSIDDLIRTQHQVTGALAVRRVKLPRCSEEYQRISTAMSRSEELVNVLHDIMEKEKADA